MTTRYKSERIAGQSKKKQHTYGAFNIDPVYNRIRYGTVRGYVRRCGLFGYRYYQLNVYAHGKRRGRQYALRYLHPACTLMLCDKLVCVTTLGMKHISLKNSEVK